MRIPLKLRGIWTPGNGPTGQTSSPLVPLSSKTWLTHRPSTESQFQDSVPATQELCLLPFSFTPTYESVKSFFEKLTLCALWISFFKFGRRESKKPKAQCGYGRHGTFWDPSYPKVNSPRAQKGFTVLTDTPLPISNCTSGQGIKGRWEQGPTLLLS